MRITGGLAKGRLIISPKGLNVRPTSDKVRETIFNVAGQDLTGVMAIDLFAGTGSLGLEALSRGATKAVFIDNSSYSINLIKKNLALCGYTDISTVLKRDLKKGLYGVSRLARDSFGMVFLDPPYRKGLIPFLLKTLPVAINLSNNAQVIVESASDEYFSTSEGGLEMVDSRIYGDTKLSIYIYKGP